MPSGSDFDGIMEEVLPAGSREAFSKTLQEKIDANGGAKAYRLANEEREYASLKAAKQHSRKDEKADVKASRTNGKKHRR